MCIRDSDSTWQTTDSPVIFNSIYTAEHYDAQKELAGWDSPGFNATGWYHAQETESPTETIKSQVMHPIRETARYTATQCKKINDSCYVYHFPKNIAGVTELKVKGKKGTNIKSRRNNAAKRTEKLPEKRERREMPQAKKVYSSDS